MTMKAVKAAPGRVAFTAPSDGKPIPSDVFMTVRSSNWIEHLIATGDVVEQKSAPVAVAATPAVKGA